MLSKAAEDHVVAMRRLYQSVMAAHQAMLHSTSADEVFGRICSIATEYGMKMAWVGVAEGNAVRLVTWSGEGSEYLDGIVITINPDDPHSWGPTGTAVRTGKHVVCNDFQNDERTAPWHERGRRFGWGSSAAFPLFRQGMVMGALTIYSEDVGYFGSDELGLLDDLAGDISFLLDRFHIEARKNELEAALQKSLDHLVDANLELERFSEIYSHDLQEPVRNVVSFSQFLQRRLEGRLDDDTKGLLDTLVDAARRIGQLNLDLLAFGRARHGELQLSPAHSGKALDYACGELGAVMRAAGAEIRVQPLPMVLGTDAELRQVFINLLSNALKFAAPERPPIIEVEARPEENGWHFTFRDNGIGIAEQYVDKVFGVFVRLHTSATYPGSGTGLAITRRIIQRQGGRIWIESQLGAGTVVHFWLRAPETEAISPSPPNP